MSNTIYQDIYANGIDYYAPITVNNSVDLNKTIRGDFKVSSSLTVNGEDISKSLAEIKDRLAILEPDFEKMERFAALKKAYENYKMIERMIRDE